MTDSKPNLFEVLGLPSSATMDDVEARFLDTVRTRIQAVAASYDEAAVKAEEDMLRSLHEQFFQFSKGWAAMEMKKPREKPDHPDAAKQKKKASTLIETMQANIIEFALCYMHINRFSTLLRDEIRSAEVKMGGTVAKNVKWSSDTGLVIARYKKQKKQILDDTQRMAQVRDILAGVEEELGVIRRCIITLFGADRAEPYIRKMTAAFRTGEFRRARLAVKEIVETKKKFGLDQKTAADNVMAFEGAAATAIGLLEDNQKKLASMEEGKLFLRPVETDIAFNNHVRELRKIKAFLAKYHLPYMEYKLDTLNHLREKLMVVGSLDSLMVLYRRLLAGIANPLPDIREVRLYENEVLDKTAYMLEGQFKEIPKIMERAVETVQEFRQNNDDFEDMARVDDMQEVEIDAQQAAGGGS